MGLGLGLRLALGLGLGFRDLAVLAAAVDSVVGHGEAVDLVRGRAKVRARAGVGRSGVGHGEAVDLRAGVEGEDELHQLQVPHLYRVGLYHIGRGRGGG